MTFSTESNRLTKRWTSLCRKKVKKEEDMIKISKLQNWSIHKHVSLLKTIILQILWFYLINNLKLEMPFIFNTLVMLYYPKFTLLVLWNCGADLPTLESQKSYYFPSKFIFFDENSYYVVAALRGAIFRLHILNVTNFKFWGEVF